MIPDEYPEQEPPPRPSVEQMRADLEAWLDRNYRNRKAT